MCGRRAVVEDQCPEEISRRELVVLRIHANNLFLLYLTLRPNVLRLYGLICASVSGAAATSQGCGKAAPVLGTTHAVRVVSCERSIGLDIDEVVLLLNSLKYVMYYLSTAS